MHAREDIVCRQRRTGQVGSLRADHLQQHLQGIAAVESRFYEVVPQAWQNLEKVALRVVHLTQWSPATGRNATIFL